MDCLKKGTTIKIFVVLEDGREIGFEATVERELQSQDMRVSELRERLSNLSAIAHTATNSADKLINRLRNENKLLEASVDDLRTQLEDLEGRVKSLSEEARTEDEFQIGSRGT